MSLVVGKHKNVRINKYLLFEIMAFVFKDFQIFELLIKLCRTSKSLALKNRSVLEKICSQKGMYFSQEQPLNTLN